MTSEKKCPLLIGKVEIKFAGAKECYGQCIENECGFWNESHKKCGIACMSEKLSGREKARKALQDIKRERRG